MISSQNKEVFFALIRLGIGHQTGFYKSGIEWRSLELLAEKQGLLAVLVDGVDNLPVEARPPKDVLLQWIGNTLQGYEYRFDKYCQTIADLSGWHNKHGLKMMVLKGYACAINWPKPEHRPCGDIDIWQFGRQQEADSLLLKEKGIKVDNQHHHHTVFDWNGFTIENHYDFLNVHHHKSNVALEAILKELGKDDSHHVELNRERVYLPSPNLHALFLLRHSMSNFASTGMILRQLLDWGFFVKAHAGDIDWQWLKNILNKYGMKPLFDVYNSICVEDLGFDSTIFPYVQFNPMIKERVLNDIMSPEFSEIESGGFIKRAAYKYRRWKANAWKHELCFSESLSSAFWSGVKSHLLKPSSI